MCNENDELVSTKLVINLAHADRISDSYGIHTDEVFNERNPELICSI